MVSRRHINKHPLKPLLKKMDWSDIPVEKLPGMRKLHSLVSEYYENRLLNRVKNRGHLPEHIGIILDGNRRFAEREDLSKDGGHTLGARKLEDVLDWAREIGNSIHDCLRFLQRELSEVFSGNTGSYGPV